MTESTMLLIVPYDWIELDAVSIMRESGYDAATIAAMLLEPHLGAFYQTLENIGRPLPVGQMVVAGRIFDDGSGYRIWVKLGPEI